MLLCVESGVDAVLQKIVEIGIHPLCESVKLRVGFQQPFGFQLAIVGRDLVSEHRFQPVLFRLADFLPREDEHLRRLGYVRDLRHLAVEKLIEHRLFPFSRKHIPLVSRNGGLVEIVVVQPAQLRVEIFDRRHALREILYLFRAVVPHAVHVVPVQEHQLKVLVLFRGFHDIPENVHKAFSGLVPADVCARAALGDPVSRPLGVRPGVEVVPLQALVLRLLGDPAHRLPGVYEHTHSSVRDVCKTFAEALFRLYDLVRDAALRRFAGARRVLRRFRRLEFFGISEQLGDLRVLLRAQLRPSRLGSLLVRGGVRAVGLLVHPLRGELRSLFLFKFPEPLHVLPAVGNIDPVLHAVRVHLRGVRPDPALSLCGYLGFSLGDELLEEPLHARRRRFRDPLSGVRRGVRLRFKRQALLRLSPQRLALLGAHRLGLFVLHPGGSFFRSIRV